MASFFRLRRFGQASARGHEKPRRMILALISGLRASLENANEDDRGRTKGLMRSCCQRPRVPSFPLPVHMDHADAQLRCHTSAASISKLDGSNLEGRVLGRPPSPSPGKLWRLDDGEGTLDIGDLSCSFHASIKWNVLSGATCHIAGAHGVPREATGAWRQLGTAYALIRLRPNRRPSDPKQERQS